MLFCEVFLEEPKIKNLMKIYTLSRRIHLHRGLNHNRNHQALLGPPENRAQILSPLECMEKDRMQSEEISACDRECNAHQLQR